MNYISGELKPRQIPKPTHPKKDNIQFNVPDVSLFSPTEPVRRPFQNYPTESYHKWKLDGNVQPIPYTQYRPVGKENIPETATKIPIRTSETNTSILKKVRFENSTNVRPEPYLATLSAPNDPYVNSRKEFDIVERRNKLDLSLMEPRPPIHAAFQNTNRAIDPYPRYTPQLTNYHDWIVQKSYDMPNRTEENKKDEASISDLCDMIKVQNEQLMVLQTQVQALLSAKDPPPKQEVSRNSIAIQTDESEMPVTVSIGLMTSLEFKLNPEKEPEPKRTEIRNNESGTYSKTNDYSFALDDIQEVPEVESDNSVMQNSVRIDMEEFNNNSKSEPELQSPNIGWTIYNNVVGQVKNILEKSPQQQQQRQYITSTQNHQDLLDKVKTATIQQLQNLGISVMNPAVNISEPSDDSNYDTTDMSVEINQLIMKYLGNDELNELIVKNQVEAKNVGAYTFYNGRNELSFSTIKYMQKYNMMEPKQRQRPAHQEMYPQRQELRSPSQRNMSQNKILDITALKQQPKLL